MKTKVLDSLPGTGKSTAVFKMMAERKMEEKYIYVSPLLTEVTDDEEFIARVNSDQFARKLNFKSPGGKGAKSEEVLKLLEDGENISCTHALFLNMDHRHWDIIRNQSYCLVLDEELAVVERFSNAKRGDLRLMVKSGLAEVTEPHSKVKINYTVENFKDTNFENIAEAAEEGCLFTAKHPEQYNFMVTSIPIELLKSAKSVLVLTYMFKGSVMDLYLKLNGLKWEYCDVPLYRTSQEVITKLKDLIVFKTTPAVDELSKFSLSHTWYAQARQEQRLKVGSAIASVRRREGAGRLLLTLPKDYAVRGRKSVCRPKDAAAIEQWLWAGTRATNDYADKDVILHLYNRNPNENVRVYFETHGLELDRDHFALAEMIQFVFRSAVRKGKPITLYVASGRMKRLFSDWLNQVGLGVLEAA